MRRILLAALGLLAIVAVRAQEALDPARAEELASRIVAAHEGIVSINSDFTQTKSSPLFVESVVQKGRFEYVAPEDLVWEYTWPTAMKLNMGERANKMSMMLKNMIVNAITGASLSDSRNFQVSYSIENTGDIVVDLKPLTRRMKGMYEGLRLFLDAKTLYARSVRFDEPGGACTTIVFENLKVEK